MHSPTSIIPQSDDRLFSYFLSEVIKGILGIGDKTEREKRDGMILILLLGLIAITGTEPLKVLLRRNIGKRSLSMARISVASFLYWLWALVFIYLTNEFPNLTSTFYACATFYFLFGLFTLALGKKEYNNASIRYRDNKDDSLLHFYRGDSVFFSFSKKDKSIQNKIWMRTEPLTCFLIGFILTILPFTVHPILCLFGIPIVITAISFWFNEWFQINNVWNVQANKIAREREQVIGSQKNFDEEDYHQVSTI